MKKAALILAICMIMPAIAVGITRSRRVNEECSLNPESNLRLREAMTRSNGDYATRVKEPIRELKQDREDCPCDGEKKEILREKMEQGRMRDFNSSREDSEKGHFSRQKMGLRDTSL